MVQDWKSRNIKVYDELRFLLQCFLTFEFWKAELES